MALLDGQYSYRGLIFGDGCEILVNSAEGFEGFDMRTSDSDQPRGDGGIRGLDYVAPRTVAFELVAWDQGDGDGTTYESAWAAVRSSFRPSRSTDFDLTFKRPGQPERLIRCRPVQLVRNEAWDRYGRSGYPPVVLRAVDPRVYSTRVRTGIVPVYSATSSGIDFPLEFDEDFLTSTGTQIEFVAQNDGTADAFPLIRFYGHSSGSITSVTLTNTTTDQELTISAEIVDGQVLHADMEAAVTGSNALVIHLDGASRYGDWALPREAFALAPGSNTLRYEIEGTATNSVCALTWRDTWLD
jgi:hypothetical protein